MGCAKQAIRNEVQHATNTTDQAQPNPTPQGPPPMVLQNPLPVQGLVATAPPPQPVVRISPYYRGKNVSLMPIGHKGRFLPLENSKKWK